MSRVPVHLVDKLLIPSRMNCGLLKLYKSLSETPVALHEGILFFFYLFSLKN